MNPVIDFWTILFLIAAAQGLFLSVLIYSKKSKTNNLLASLILLFTLCLFYYVSYWTGVDKDLPFFISITLGFNYLIGPLLYFYIRSDSNNTFFDIRHFIPFGMFLALYISVPFISPDARPVIRGVQIIIQNIHLIVYSWLIYRWIVDHKEDNNDEAKWHQWRKQVFWSYLGYVMCFISYYILVYASLLQVEYDYMISLASSFFIYFVGYKGFVNPYVMEHYQPKTKYEKSSLSENASDLVLSEIKTVVETKKLYLNSELKLQHLAEELSFSTHHISQVINQKEGKSFSDFINTYRIQEAQLILSDSNSKQIKIINVAYDTGFNNKVSFNNAFKKITGVSPSQYRDNPAGVLS